MNMQVLQFLYIYNKHPTKQRTCQFTKSIYCQIYQITGSSWHEQLMDFVRESKIAQIIKAVGICQNLSFL